MWLVRGVTLYTNITGKPRLCFQRNLGHGRPCKGRLLRCVELSRGRQILYPIKVYCYAPLRVYVQSLLNRPGFIGMCDYWKNSHASEGVYRDVYDGALWREFQVYNGKPFLSDSYAYGLMLNIDWFRPCKDVEYSIGAIYLTIMNLPRPARFRQENVMLVGLILGPKEPKHDVNSQLKPLVEELLEFWDGIFLNVGSNNRARVRCALLCVAADVPASRKVCGFLGHAGQLGCSKCLKIFPGRLGNRDYSCFNRPQWPLRDKDLHRRNIDCIQRSTTVTQQMELESKFGCRYSALLALTL